MISYGTIFAMDYDPNLRLMALYGASAANGYHGMARNTWWAIVLVDEHWGSFTRKGIALGWEPGSRVTFSPMNDGLIVVEEADDE
jgi:hypothetical protein